MSDTMTPKLWRWIGWVLTGLFTAFMIFDTSIKLLDLEIVRESLVGLGYPAHLGRGIGVIELVCLVFFLVPRTSLLGAILMMSVLGGGITSQMRLEAPLFSHVLFGVYLGLLMWGGLFLRDSRLRGLFPIRR
ncbi:DoxX family protein [Phenylobacterium sp. LH3H17]|uniref:DoxX family protein n=1 Tax=Phenylobacterium sp. LH3H17 TaxID=2903901 RepID=UPI0020C954D4|nr:DoxX family protein [Phenylobacterium sp. LH3H17]UTP38921.1 DoxX family protein [Phenylobacterium sp. LH3H17]